jgi:hypothetical protein
VRRDSESNAAETYITIIIMRFLTNYLWRREEGWGGGEIMIT